MSQIKIKKPVLEIITMRLVVEKKTKNRLVKLGKLGMAGCTGFLAGCSVILLGYRIYDPWMAIPAGLACSSILMVKDVVSGGSDYDQD